MRVFKVMATTLLLLAFTWNSCWAADAAFDIKIDVKEFQLNNGMLFLVVERPVAPQVACRLAIRAGSALEETGKTGIAHMLEHMMFKGTQNFGTRDNQKDKELQAQIEAAFKVVRAEQQKRRPDQVLIRKKLAEMETLRLEVQKIYVPQALSSQLGKNGAVGVNAFTTKDQTQYMASMPADMLEQWFAIISEQLFEPAWREFYVEKEVVLREWAFRYINNPAGAAWLDLDATAYSAHPYRNPTIGWQADMENFSTQDAIDFHRQYYNPTNAVCVLVGDVTVDQARRLAGIYFARYPAGRRAPETVTREPPQEGPRRSIRYLNGARTPLVRIGFHGARMETKDFYALDALTMILSQGLSARLTQNIINQGLAVEAWAYNPDNRYGGMVILGGSPNEPEQGKEQPAPEDEKRKAYREACERLENLLLAEVAEMQTELVSDRELARIKKLNQREFLKRMRSNEQLAGTLATLEVEVGWRYLTDYLEKMAAVEPADIRQAARRYFRPENKTSIYVLPGDQPSGPPEPYTEVRSISGSAAAEALPQGAWRNISRWPTPAGWRHPLSFERHPHKVEYPQPEILEVVGAKIFYLPDNELPLIDLTLLVKAGAVDLDATKTGLTDVLGQILIRGGTQKYSPSEVAQILDENAIQLDIAVAEEETRIHLAVLSDDWEKGLDVLREVITQPRFDPGVLSVIKDQELTDLQRQGGQAQAVAMREAEIWHFKGHPYGRDPLLGLQTIPDISSEDLERFLQAYFVPANMTAAIAGDIEKERVAAGLRQFFQALPSSPAPERRLDDPRENAPVLTLIPKPGQVQSQVVMVLPSLKRTHPDYWKAGLLMNIFGGSDSLLYSRLRDDLGLAYSAGFYQTYKWSAGILWGYIGCRGDRTSAAIRETIKIMKSLREAIPSRDLELKRLDALNGFVFNVDTRAELVEVYGRYHMRREPLDTLERIQDAFIGATREDLHRLALDLLDPRKLQIFVVGDKNIQVKTDGGSETALEEDLRALAQALDLPYQEVALR
ncbi:MAG: insulinase family protein [Desulfobacterales bacterium]|nr:MAG: insulinase family protein [Desulfobacterales bacterium]